MIKPAKRARPGHVFLVRYLFTSIITVADLGEGPEGPGRPIFLN